MSIERCTFSNNLKAKELYYSDDFFSLKGEKVTPSDSFTFNSYEALKDVNDFKTNNYSNLFLTKKQRTSNWLNSNSKDKDDIKGFATTFSWKLSDDEDYWLYFAKNYTLWDLYVKKVDLKITNTKSEKDYHNYIFYLDLIDENKCKISHTFGDLKMYLSVQSDKTIAFLTEPQQGEDEFIYELDEDKLRLFKKVEHKDKNNSSYYRLYQLEIKRQQDKSYNLVLSSNTKDINSNSICYITNNLIDFNFYIDSSWVAYDRSKYVSSIDESRSAKGLETQALIHHQYNSDGGFNFIPLKNNLTYKGNSIRGNNTNLSDLDFPDVDYRTYTTINSGMNQEKGNDNIILNFTFVDQEYTVEEGQDLTFTIDSEDGALPALFPYKYININDTKFIKNGSFGSNVPFFADKVKKLQTNSKIEKSSNNATYLCTWLYRKDNESVPVWLDRYYYPDLISRKNAHYQYSPYDDSFNNILDKNYIKSSDFTVDNNGTYHVKTNTIANKIHQETYFDKISDLTIEENCSYRYQRLSKSMVNEVLDGLESNRISTVVSDSLKEIDLLDEFIFDNEHYRKLKYDKWGKTNAVNLNFDIYLQRKKRMGIQLFGTDYTHGFNIQNRKDLVPFHYYATKEIAYLLNNKFEIVHQFDLKAKYADDEIKKIILGDVFDDLIIVGIEHLYIFSYDLQLKNRIHIEDDIYKVAEDVNYFTEDILKDYLQSSDSNPVLYKNNIYIPYNQQIVKIVFCPDSSEDLNYFEEIEEDEEYTKEDAKEDAAKKPAYIRFLKDSEYQLNYLKVDNSTDSKGMISETIRVDNKIKNIYISEDGTIYGLNYSQYGVSLDKDTLYGIYNNGRQITENDETMWNGEWDWIYNQSLGKLYGDISSAQYGEFSSPNSIDKIRFNDIGEMCLIRNFNNPDNYEDVEDNKRMDIYDITKKRIYTYDLSTLDKVYSLDAYNFIDEAHDEQTCFTAIGSAGNMVYRVTYLSKDKKILFTKIEIPETRLVNVKSSDTSSVNLAITDQKEEEISPLPFGDFETVNSNRLMSYENYNSLYFNLHVPSKYVYENIATIKWVLDDIQDGWYNINVAIDLDAGIFEVKINDDVYKTIDSSTYSWFEPFVSSNGTIFNMTYYIGTLGKKYGTTMNKILKNSKYDPYNCKDSSIQNMQLYTKTLSYYEYQAMRLRGKPINKLILTLPCGNRNNLDEIVRYFKYVSSPAISNKIKINVAGTGLKTEGEFNLLRKEIMTVLENNKDCLVDVKEIEFIETGKND